MAAEPGAHGNYTDYKRRRRPAPDRLSLILPEWTDGKRVLDLGSNDGTFAISVASSSSHKPKEVIGFELDSQLVREARRTVRRHAAAASHILMGQKVDSADGISGDKMPPPWSEVWRRIPLRNDATSSSLAQINDIGRATLLQEPGYPFNIRFVQRDITKLTTPEIPFDVVLCLSVTKWVHLYGGDEAIMALFRSVHDSLLPGGIFILEPQPWESYKRKRNLSKEVAGNFKSIKKEPSEFPSILTKSIEEGGIGFDSKELLRDRGPKGSSFNRQVWKFQKKRH